MPLVKTHVFDVFVVTLAMLYYELNVWLLKDWIWILIFQNKGSDIIQCSILGHILPEAMVHFLENHSAEKFAETYLGEFDTPEAIWSNEMR